MVNVWILTQLSLTFLRISCQGCDFQQQLHSIASQCSLNVTNENQATLRKVQIIHTKRSKKPNEISACSKEQERCLPATYCTWPSTLSTHRIVGRNRVMSDQLSLPWLFNFIFLAFRSLFSSYIASDVLFSYCIPAGQPGPQLFLSNYKEWLWSTSSELLGMHTSLWVL